MDAVPERVFSRLLWHATRRVEPQTIDLCLGRDQ